MNAGVRRVVVGVFVVAGVVGAWFGLILFLALSIKFATWAVS